MSFPMIVWPEGNPIKKPGRLLVWGKKIQDYYKIWFVLKIFLIKKKKKKKKKQQKNCSSRFLVKHVWNHVVGIVNCILDSEQKISGKKISLLTCQCIQLVCFFVFFFFFSFLVFFLVFFFFFFLFFFLRENDTFSKEATICPNFLRVAEWSVLSSGSCWCVWGEGGGRWSGEVVSATALHCIEPFIIIILPSSRHDLHFWKGHKIPNHHQPPFGKGFYSKRKEFAPKRSVWEQILSF